MEGILDFDASIAIPKGNYFLSRKFFLLPPKQYSYANINTLDIKNGSDKNARDILVKAYDAIPLSDNFSKIEWKHFVAARKRAKRQRIPRKPVDLSGLSRMEFAESPPDSEEDDEGGEGSEGRQASINDDRNEDIRDWYVD
jgi:hypothetical protein